MKTPRGVPIEELKEDFVRKIKAAFANVEYPGDENIGNEIYLGRFIGQKEWQKIPLDVLRQVSSIYSFSPHAFHYFLPAFLVGVLLYPEIDEKMLDILIWQLSPRGEYKSTLEHALDLNLFSDMQKAVILEFLQNHQSLFPDSNIVLFEDEQQRLREAIQFWKSQIG